MAIINLILSNEIESNSTRVHLANSTVDLWLENIKKINALEGFLWANRNQTEREHKFN